MHKGAKIEIIEIKRPKEGHYVLMEQLNAEEV